MSIISFREGSGGGKLSSEKKGGLATVDLLAILACAFFSISSLFEGGRGGKLASERSGGKLRKLDGSSEGLRLSDDRPGDTVLIRDVLAVIEAKDSFDSRRTICCSGDLGGSRGGTRGGRAGEGLAVPLVELIKGGPVGTLAGRGGRICSTSVYVVTAEGGIPRTSTGSLLLCLVSGETNEGVLGILIGMLLGSMSDCVGWKVAIPTICCGFNDAILADNGVN